MDEYNEWKPVFDENGNAVTAAGKVDAYRFKTFYLDSTERNFEDLFGKVVDPPPTVTRLSVIWRCITGLISRIAELIATKMRIFIVPPDRWERVYRTSAS